MLFKWLRKIGKLLRGGAGKREILLGVLLGFLLGMVPGLNLTVALLVLLLLILNANLAVGLPAYAIGKLFAITIAPISFKVGYFLIHKSGLTSFFEFLAETPYLALMDFQVYCLTGGVLLGLTLGLLLGLVIAELLLFLRKSMMQLTQKSERLQKFLNAAPMRVSLRIVFGPALKKDGSHLEHSPLFRKSGVKIVAVLVVLLLLSEWFLLDIFLAGGVQHALQLGTGAQVDIGSADLSLLKGRLELTDVAATDPENPMLNLFETNRMTADLSISDLARKRAVLELVHVGRLATATKREEAGEVYREKEPAPEKPKLPDEKDLSDYLADAEKIRDWFIKLQDYLERVRSLQKTATDEEPPDPEILEKQAKAVGYFALSAHGVLTRKPSWTIENLVIEDLRFPMIEEPRFFTAETISSHPHFAGAPMQLSVRKAEDLPTELAVVLDFLQPNSKHQLSANIEKLEFSAESLLNEDFPVNVNSGVADIRANGTFSSGELDIPFSIDLQNLELSTRSENQQYASLLQPLQNIEITGQLYGSLANPRLKVQAPDVMGKVRDAAVRAGEKRLKKEAESQLEKLKDGTQEKLKGRLKDFFGN